MNRNERTARSAAKCLPPSDGQARWAYGVLVAFSVTPEYAEYARTLV